MHILTLLHLERPKLYGVFGLSECKRVKIPGKSEFFMSLNKSH